MMSADAIGIGISIAFIIAWQELQLQGEYFGIEHHYKRN